MECFNCYEHSYSVGEKIVKTTCPIDQHVTHISKHTYSITSKPQAPQQNICWAWSIFNILLENESFSENGLSRHGDACTQLTL